MGFLMQPTTSWIRRFFTAVLIVSAVACAAGSENTGIVPTGSGGATGQGGVGGTATPLVDNDGDGFFDDVDCDDDDFDVNPDATEVCDGIDNDCDDVVDGETAEDATVWYEDKDGDGYGVKGLETLACSQPEGYADKDGDCNDDDKAYHPGATEDDCADPNDYNCDGSSQYQDKDSDGYAACEECDDSKPKVYPGAPELCDGLDNDCNGAADADLAGEVDADNDGSLSCEDCDDNDGQNYPGNTEQCDGQDNDCNNVADAAGGEFDLDMDGSLSCVDCDDNDGQNYPGNTEKWDGQDNDCNQLADAGGGEVDVDKDGSLSCADCNDADANNFPGNVEKCDGQDNDCNMLADADPLGEVDGDNDNVLSCADCDDNDADR